MLLVAKLVSVGSVVAVTAWLLWSAVNDLSWGAVVVRDGNTLTVGGEELMLFGIDAPELAQTCRWTGHTVPCGMQARDALREHVGPRHVWCVAKATDASGVHSICYLGTAELNRWMVASGWALADRRYTARYVTAEARARGRLVGIWPLHFELPRTWRQTHAQRRKAA